MSYEQFASKSISSELLSINFIILILNKKKYFLTNSIALTSDWKTFDGFPTIFMVVLSFICFYKINKSFNEINHWWFVCFGRHYLTDQMVEKAALFFCFLCIVSRKHKLWWFQSWKNSIYKSSGWKKAFFLISNCLNKF